MPSSWRQSFRAGIRCVRPPSGYIFPEPRYKFGLLQNAINALLDHNVPQVRIWANYLNYWSQSSINGGPQRGGRWSAKARVTYDWWVNMCLRQHHTSHVAYKSKYHQGPAWGHLPRTSPMISKAKAHHFLLCSTCQWLVVNIVIGYIYSSRLLWQSGSGLGVIHWLKLLSNNWGLNFFFWGNIFLSGTANVDAMTDALTHVNQLVA